MEQNLSEKERKIRLLIGLGFLIGSIVSYIQGYSQTLSIALIIASAGVIANYFTCFCGTKKLIGRLKR